jgi:aminoglycoside phosphotransferase (APT) family kinase protein
MRVKESKIKLTVAQVEEFLARHTQQTITNISPLVGGEWSQAFAFNMNGRSCVIRFGRHAEDYKKDKLASGFSSKYLPIARVLEVGSAFEGYFAISEQAFGEMLNELGPDDMQKIVSAVMQMLNAMREADVSSTQGLGRWGTDGDAPYSSWKSYLLRIEYDDPERRPHGWRAKLASSPMGDSVFMKALERLKELIDVCPEERHLIHGDLPHSNVLVKDDQISTVIDWGNSAYGDFLYDVAWVSYCVSWHPAMKGIDWEGEAEKFYSSIGVALPNFKERLLCYKLHIGLEAQSTSAFTERWDELKINTEKILKLVK